MVELQPEQDEAAALRDSILYRLKHELYPDAVRVLQLREQTVRRQITKLEEMQSNLVGEMRASQARMAKIVASNINSEEQPMGPIHGNEDTQLKGASAVAAQYETLLATDVGRLTEPLKKMLRVAEYRAQRDAAYLALEFNKLELVIGKLASPDSADIMAPRLHFFAYPFGERFKSTIFKYDEVLGTCAQLRKEMLDFRNSRSIQVEQSLIQFASGKQPKTTRITYHEQSDAIETTSLRPAPAER